MQESNTEAIPSDAIQRHRLLTLLTVEGLNLALLQRHLDRQQPSASDAMRETLKRVTQAHRAIIDELRPPRREG